MKLPYLFILLFLSSCGIRSQEAVSSSPPLDSGKKVLFIGNSYTYFWNLSETVEIMSQEMGHAITSNHSTAGGVNLGQHWREENGLSSKTIIESGEYDIIILQDHSMRTIEHPDSLKIFGQKLNQSIQFSGATCYLYMTWAREWDPNMQETITKEYSALAKDIAATIVPVGPAWERARQLRPKLKLYDNDGSHPSSLGTYLTACVFYGLINKTSPVGLNHRIISTDKKGEPFYLNIQSKHDALFCQKVAAEILTKFHPHLFKQLVNK